MPYCVCCSDLAVLEGDPHTCQPSRFSREYTGVSASLPPYFLDSRLFSVILLVISGLLYIVYILLSIVYGLSRFFRQFPGFCWMLSRLLSSVLWRLAGMDPVAMGQTRLYCPRPPVARSPTPPTTATTATNLQALCHAGEKKKGGCGYRVGVK